MKQFKALDTFCKAGGATKGLQRAGFYVVGVDIEDQKHYCGDLFVQGDALEFIRKYGREFDFIWASPPCQGGSWCTPVFARGRYPNLIPQTREALRGCGVPYCIENVGGYRRELVEPLKLCGSMFDLGVFRHRWFELQPRLFSLTPRCCHDYVPFLMQQAGSNSRKLQRVKRHPGKTGIDWMTQDELANAIPPAYSEFIGKQAIQYLKRETS